jgi:hypothetical protein
MTTVLVAMLLFSQLSLAANNANLRYTPDSKYSSLEINTEVIERGKCLIPVSYKR